MKDCVFVVGQPLPAYLPAGVERLVCLESPVVSCYFCSPAVYERSVEEFAALVSSPADDMRHLDGRVFFNFVVHSPTLHKLSEGALLTLMQRASIMLDHARGIDYLAPPRIVLTAQQEDALNPTYEFTLGGMQVTDARLERGLQALFGAEWESHWSASGSLPGSAQFIHHVTGFAVRQEGRNKPYYDETGLRLALTPETRLRLQQQGQMLFALAQTKARATTPATRVARPPVARGF
jgi:hypothetical protein